MPQVMIDTDTESPVSLRMLADLLTSYAKLKEIDEAGAARAVANVSAQIPCAGANCGSTNPKFHSEACVEEHARSSGQLPALDVGMPVTGLGLPSGSVIVATEEGDDLTHPQPNPATVFAHNAVPVAPVGPSLPGNVLPFPGAPSFPVIPPVNTAAAQQPTLNLAPPAGAAGPVASAIVELDSAGLPWDARIHQDTKGKNKGDGTWRVKRGIETKHPGLLAQVTAELTAAKLATLPPVVPPVTTATGPIPGTGQPSAPVTLPPVMSLPGPIVGPAGGPLVFPNMPPASPAGTVFPVPNGLPPASAPVPNVGLPAPSNPVALFQALMMKIGQALNATPPLVTQEQITTTHVGMGLPQLQMLLLQPERIPQFEAALGL